MVRKGQEHNNIGVDAAPPKGRCEDKKCPWHGKLSLRGRTFIGTVISAKASKSAVVEWPHTQFLPKYERYERRSSSVVAYNPECISAKSGDRVRIMECRPLSKTKSFAVIEVL